MPSLSVVQVVPSRRRNEAPALSSPPKPIEPSMRPADEPLEADRHLQQAAPEVGHDPVDHRGRDERLADGHVPAPVAGAAEEVGDRGREEVVRVEQPSGGRDDPVAVGVGVVADGEIEAVAQGDEAGHRVGRRGVHPDPAVPVDGHEPEGRVDGLVHDRQVEAVALADRRPVVDARPAQRVHAQAQAGRPDRVHVEDGAQVAHVDAPEVVGPRRRAGPIERDPRDVVDALFEDPVGLVLDPAGHVGVGRAAVGRVVLEAAVLGRVVGGVTTMPSARPVVRPRF